MGKGEIAHYEQFLLFPWCFQKACFPGASKGVIVWEWVKNKPPNRGYSSLNPLPDDKILTLSKLKAFADDNFDVAQIAKFSSCSLENIVEKGENAGFQHFLLFPQCFQKVSF